MDDSVHFFSPKALQLLGLESNVPNVFPQDVTDNEDTVNQCSLPSLVFNQDSLILEGFCGIGSDVVNLPSSVPLLGLDQSLLNGRTPYYLADSHTEHAVSASSEDRPGVPSVRKRPAPEIVIFPAADDQQQKNCRRKKFDPTKRQKVAQVRKDGACMRCHFNKSPVGEVLGHFLHLFQ